MTQMMQESRRLGRLGECDQVSQNGRRAAQALLGSFPIGKKHDLHIGTHTRGSSLLMDEGNKAIRIGEPVLAK